MLLQRIYMCIWRAAKYNLHTHTLSYTHNTLNKMQITYIQAIFFHFVKSLEVNSTPNYSTSWHKGDIHLGKNLI